MTLRDRTTFLTIAKLAMTILLWPAGGQGQQVSKAVEALPSTWVLPDHRYSLTFPDRFSVCTMTPAHVRWKDSLVRNLHFQGSVHVFRLTDLVVLDRGVERRGLVYQHTGNPNRFMVKPDEFPVVIDRKDQIIGTLGCGGVSVHPHPDKQMIACLAPGTRTMDMGVWLSQTDKTGVEPPVFMDNRVYWTWDLKNPTTFPDRIPTIHVFVALCDNEHQGIVPVPKELGNGDDPAHNLYWGAMYGVKTFLRKSQDWTLVKTQKSPSEEVLERIVLKHKTAPAYLVADAYRGDQIQRAIADFLGAAAGSNPTTLQRENESLGLYGGAELVVYVGHNGLMDFNVESPAPRTEAKPREALVLACKSKPYFQPRLSQFKSKSVLLTTGFMAPEAYTLEAAVAGWLSKEMAEKIKERAARAYDKYQKCGGKAARNLFYSEE